LTKSKRPVAKPLPTRHQFPARKAPNQSLMMRFQPTVQ
jgi:hypothetical protein